MIFHQPKNSRSNYNYNAFFYTDEIWDFHFHKNFELIYVIKGEVECTVDNQTYQLCEKQFGLCLPYDVHAYHPCENARYWVLVFSEDFVRFFSNSIIGKNGDGFAFYCDTAVEEYIKTCLIHNPTPSILTLKSCLYAICEQYSLRIPLVDKNRKKAEIIAVITDYVVEHHTQNISLRDISKQVGYDYNYMSRYFRNVFNMTFTEFVNLYRLETAIQLLEETEKNITDIAYESGFKSVRTFNAFFKKNTSLSPTQYKKASRR